MENEQAKERVKKLIFGDTGVVVSRMKEIQALEADRTELQKELNAITREIKDKDAMVKRDIEAIIELIRVSGMSFTSATVITHFCTLTGLHVGNPCVEETFNKFKEVLQKKADAVDD